SHPNRSTVVDKKREVTLTIKEVGDAAAGTLRGYGSVYGNIDSAGDIMAPGCFAKSINDRASAGKKFPFLYQHNWDDPIGVIEVIKEDFRGLLIEVQLNLDTQKGRDTYSLVKQGAISGLSVGFLIVKDEVDGRGVRTIREGKLMEVSAVTFPCNEEALIESVKRLAFNGDTKMKFSNSTKQIDDALAAVNSLVKSHEDDTLTQKQFEVSIASITTLLTAAKSAAIGRGDEPQKSSDGEDDDALDKSTEAVEEADTKADADEPPEEKLMLDFDFNDDPEINPDEYEVAESDISDEEAMKSLKHSIELFTKTL
ncbi:MAG: HK97 family phage prohead protease, partial [Oxalobacteraceae bacterium]